jgi:hypothetical protein
MLMGASPPSPQQVFFGGDELPEAASLAGCWTRDDGSGSRLRLARAKESLIYLRKKKIFFREELRAAPAEPGQIRASSRVGKVQLAAAEP